jgi:hypothetical protein
MKTATALTVAAIGAIFAFAVTAQPSFFNFHVAGWVLMLTGVAGVLLPRRGYGWLRRRLVLNTGGTRRNDIDLRQRRFSRLLVPGGLITEGRDVVAADTIAADTVTTNTVATDAVANDAGAAAAGTTATGATSTVTTDTIAGVPVESDTIEQFIEE